MSRDIGFCLCLFFCLNLPACFQPETGCLDIEAKNFNLSADEACGSKDTGNGCPCTYPVLSFGTVEYIYARQDYTPGAVYQTGAQFIRINSIKFFLSGFRFIRADGESLEVADTISLSILNEAGLSELSVLKDDFILVDQQKSTQVGAIRQSGQFDSIRFVVGIEGPAFSADPLLVNSRSHPLADESMHSGDQNQGYFFNQIVLEKDTLSEVETIINIEGTSRLVEIKLPFSYKTTTGKDFSLGTLQIDHAKWLDGINFAADTDVLMMEKIIANTPSVFSLKN